MDHRPEPKHPIHEERVSQAAGARGVEAQCGTSTASPRSNDELLGFSMCGIAG